MSQSKGWCKILCGLLDLIANLCGSAQMLLTCPAGGAHRDTLGRRRHPGAIHVNSDWLCGAFLALRTAP